MIRIFRGLSVLAAFGAFCWLLYSFYTDKHFNTNIFYVFVSSALMLFVTFSTSLANLLSPKKLSDTASFNSSCQGDTITQSSSGQISATNQSIVVSGKLSGGILINSATAPGTKQVNAVDDDNKTIEIHELKKIIVEQSEKLTQYQKEANSPEVIKTSQVSPVNEVIRQSMLAGDILAVLNQTNHAIADQAQQQLALAQIHYFRAQAYDYLGEHNKAYADIETAYQLTCAREQVNLYNWHYASSYATVLDNKHSLQAGPLYQSVLNFLQLLENDDYQEDIAIILNNLAVFETAQNDNKQACLHYIEALQIRRLLAKSNPSQFNSAVASTLNNLAVLEDTQGHAEQALMYYDEALELLKNLAKSNPARFNAEFADTLNNLGNLKASQGDIDEAYTHYSKALALLTEFSANNTERNKVALAKVLNNFGVLKINQSANAEALFDLNNALDIWRDLALDKPETFNKEIADILVDMAIAKEKLGFTNDAHADYEEALQLDRMLAQSNPARFNLDVTETLVNLIGFYLNNPNHPQFKMAKLYAEEARDLLSPHLFKGNTKADKIFLSVIKISRALGI